MYYHGSSSDLVVGDLILPPDLTKTLSEDTRKKNLDRVFFSNEFKHARVYAGRAVNSLGGIKTVYVVEPIGDVICINNTPGCSTFHAERAIIVAICNIKTGKHKPIAS